ncbi:MAG: Na+/H+ antiporter [Chloroflexi bacterium]|nr:Na+/H+ antiporter [Chloroflexota bacterium]
METFEALLALLAAMVVVVTIARRVRLPYPILLVLGGLALGFVPGAPRLEVEPELVLAIFVPPLLFAAAYLTPFRDFVANKRAIAFLALGQPLLIMALVAVVTKTALPEVPWAAAFALGAIVSPTDAIAATAVFRHLGAPRRLVVVLEGESLVNDAVALVAYRTAVAVVATGSFVVADAIGQFALAAVGGVVLGLAVGFVMAEIFRRMDDPPVEVALTLLVPFVAYLPAEQLHLSGVLAAVTVGLYLSRRAARLLSSDTRILIGGVWQILTFVLNGFAFILIGLQLPEILASVRTRPLPELVLLVLAVCATVVVGRLLSVYPATYLPRMLVPSIRANDPAPSKRIVFTVGWAGMRGVVSLAAALALPSDFPERELILLLTYAVILTTLVGQGLTLPFVMRRAGVAAEVGVNPEEVTAREAAAEAALGELVELRGRWPDHLELIDQLEATYRHRARHLPGGEGTEEDFDQELVEHQAIRRSVLAAERNAVIELRDHGVINDEVLRTIERELDLESLRMEA